MSIRLCILLAICIAIISGIITFGNSPLSVAASVSNCILTMMVELPGGWVRSAKTMGDDEITVKSIVKFGSSELKPQTYMWLAGLSVAEGSPPTALALTVASGDGWFNFIPQVRLESSIGLLPQDDIVRKDELGPCGRSDYIELGSWFLPEHTYEAILSYDKREGEVSVSLSDLTEKKEVYAAFFYINKFSGSLTPCIGEVRCRETTQVEPKLDVELFEVENSYNRKGHAGVLKGGVDFGFIQESDTEAMGNHSYWNEDTILQVGRPPGRLPGEFKCVAINPGGSDVKELFSVPMGQLPTTLNIGKRLLPPGKYVVALRYSESGYTEEITRMPWEVIAPSVTARVDMPDVTIPLMIKAPRLIKGTIGLTSNQTISDVRIEVVAKPLDDELRRDNAVTVYEKTIDRIPRGETALPFVYEVTDTLKPVRFVLSVNSATCGIEPFTIAKDWPFTIEDSGTRISLLSKFEATISFDSLVNGRYGPPKDGEIGAVFVSPTGKTTNVTGVYHVS